MCHYPNRRDGCGGNPDSAFRTVVKRDVERRRRCDSRPQPVDIIESGVVRILGLVEFILLGFDIAHFASGRCCLCQRRVYADSGGLKGDGCGAVEACAWQSYHPKGDAAGVNSDTITEK